MRGYWIFAFIIILGIGAIASAQERVGDNELAYGLSFSSAGLRQDEHFTYWGAGVNYTRYFSSSNWGVMGDFSFHLRDESHLMYFLGGVRYMIPNDRVNFFVQGLGGVSYLDPKIGESQTTPVFGGGGGIDWRVWHNVAVRLPQVDLLFGSHDGENFYDVRVLLGFDWQL
jgi:hypothetical protein